MHLRNRIILTAVTQYFLITYYLMFVSISTDYWTHDGKNHEGLWMKCLHRTNVSMSNRNDTSLFSITCCSSRPFKGKKTNLTMSYTICEMHCLEVCQFILFLILLLDIFFRTKSSYRSKLYIWGDTCLPIFTSCKSL